MLSQTSEIRQWRNNTGGECVCNISLALFKHADFWSEVNQFKLNGKYGRRNGKLRECKRSSSSYSEGRMAYEERGAFQKLETEVQIFTATWYIFISL